MTMTTGYQPPRPLRRSLTRPVKRAYAQAYLQGARLRGLWVVHLLHIGKTGGNAIRNGLAIRKGRPRRFPGGVVIQEPHDVTLEMLPAGEAVAFTVREPLERFVSAFWHRYRKGKGGQEDWSAGEARAFARFTTPNMLAEALSAPDVLARQAAVEAMRAIEHICDPLAFYLISPDYLRARRSDIIDIGFVTELDRHFETLARTLKAEAVPGLPRDSRGANRTPAAFSRELSPAAVAELQKWYAVDLELYAVCCELAGRETVRTHDVQA